MANNPTSSKAIPEDRNLVNIQDDDSILSGEDKLYLWWEKNGQSIIIAIVVVVVALAGYFYYLYAQQSAEHRTQETFQNATTEEALQAFTQSYPNNPLTGSIYLDEANQAYQAEDYAQAAAKFELAIPLLPELLNARARIGLGVSLLQTTDFERGISALQEVGQDGSIVPSQRAEAYFQLAVHYWSRGDWPKVKAMEEQVRTFDVQGVFQPLLEDISSHMPEGQ